MNVCLCNYCQAEIDTAQEYARAEMMRARHGIPSVPLSDVPVRPRHYVHFHLACYDAFCAATERVVPRKNKATDAELVTLFREAELSMSPLFDDASPPVPPGGDPPTDEPIHPDHGAADHPRAGEPRG